MNPSNASNTGFVFRLSKRDDMPRKKAWTIRVLAVIFALIVCALVIVAITKQNPLQVYAGLVDGAVGNVRRTWQTIRETMILLIVAVGLTPAFKMRFWNIGAEGQILMGGCACAAVMIYCGDKMAGWLLIIVMVVVSCVAGMIWGLIPAFFKARLNTNETLFTLMLNYIAIQFVTFCIVYWENPVGSNTVGIINSATKKGWLPQIGGSQAYVLIVIIVLAVTAFMSVYMSKSKQGYEIAVVGASQNTARYAGISVRRVILRTMAISGAICGLAGFLMVSGSSHTISTETAGGRGFTAIIIAWMAHFNAVSMIIVSLLIAFLQQGAIQIASQFGLNDNASDVITGILLFFLIGSEFFIQYKVDFHGSKKEVK
ncbi:MAG: ABC transporter permease [Eubacterium sp.]|nr:ABC transporter permease [Eubacterium sp.]